MVEQALKKKLNLLNNWLQLELNRAENYIISQVLLHFKFTVKGSSCVSQPPNNRAIALVNFKVHNLGAVLWTFESTQIANENGKFYMLAIVKWLMAQLIIDISCKRKWSSEKSKLHTMLTMTPLSMLCSSIKKLIELSVKFTNGCFCYQSLIKGFVIKYPEKICFRFRPRSHFLQHLAIHKRNHLIWTFPWFMAQKLAQKHLSKNVPIEMSKDISLECRGWSRVNIRGKFSATSR